MPNTPNSCVCGFCANRLLHPAEHYASDNRPMCGDCRAAHPNCPDCGNTVAADQIRPDVPHWESGTERGVCPDCRWVCSDCGGTFRGTNSPCPADGDSLCQACFDETWFYCHDCGGACRLSHSYPHDSCDGSLCQGCYTDRCEQDDESDGENPYLHQYEYKPRSRFHSAAGVATVPVERERYFGMEIETELPRSHGIYDESTISAMKRVVGSDLWYAKTDGSLDNGVEFVSHPATLEYWRKDGITWAGELAKLGWRSHDTSTCGLHIHVSRDSLKPTQWLRVARFFADNDSIVRRAARRDPSRYARNEVGESSAAIARKIRRCGDFSRYVALNFTGERTVEFRIFRGTLNSASALRCLEFVNAVCEFARTRGRDDMKETTFGSWLQSEGVARIGEAAARSLYAWLFSPNGSEVTECAC